MPPLTLRICCLLYCDTHTEQLAKQATEMKQIVTAYNGGWEILIEMFVIQ